MAIIKLRAQAISIEMPSVQSEPWISIVVQRVEIDAEGNDLNTIDRWGSLHKRLSEVATEVHACGIPVQDPDTYCVTVEGVAYIVGVLAKAWMIEKWGGSLNAKGDVIL